MTHIRWVRRVWSEPLQRSTDIALPDEAVKNRVMIQQRKLILIALSGVRIYNKELLEVGMTLPGFVERSEVIASLPSLSLLTLAAHTPEHWEIVYREVSGDPADVVNQIVSEQYDVVAISALTARILEAYNLGDTLRAEGVSVVLGGLHVSVLPDEAAEKVVTEKIFHIGDSCYRSGKLPRKKECAQYKEKKYSIATGTTET